jgi:uncharacterized protein YutE (UPF0331/DUF86 family)
MTDEEFPVDRLNRVLSGIETIEESLGVLARKQQVTRDEYKSNSDTRDIVERRFVKMTEAAIDVAEEFVKHECGQPPEINPAAMRALGEEGLLSAALAEKMAPRSAIPQRIVAYLWLDHRSRCGLQRSPGSRPLPAVRPSGR